MRLPISTILLLVFNSICHSYDIRRSYSSLDIVSDRYISNIFLKSTELQHQTSRWMRGGAQAEIRQKSSRSKRGKRAQASRKKSNYGGESIEKTEDDGVEDVKPQANMDEMDDHVILIDSSIGSSSLIDPSEDFSLSEYFLSQHSYLYPVQCISSLLVLITGMGSLSAENDGIATILIRRALLFAGVKYLMSLVACGIVLGKGIEKIGLQATRTSKVQELLTGKSSERRKYAGVSAHCFVYCLILWLWIPLSNSKSFVGRGKVPQTRLFVVAPILLREAVNIVWTIVQLLSKSDRLVYSFCGHLFLRKISIFTYIINFLNILIFQYSHPFFNDE